MQRKTWCFVNSSQRPCSNNVAKSLKIENTKQTVRRVEGTDIVCCFFLVWFSVQVVSCVEETRVVRKEDPRSPHTLLHISNKSDESLGAYLFSKYATTCFPSIGPPTSTCFHISITLVLLVQCSAQVGGKGNAPFCKDFFPVGAWCICNVSTAPTPTTPPHSRTTQKEDKMEVVIKDCADNSYVIEVGVDDTTETMRQKVASAVGLAEDSFHMGFGGKDEGDDITQLSAGDTIILTKSKKFEARAALHALGEDITAERLVTVEDPEVACLLLQAEVATVIPYRFLAHTSLTALDLSAVSCVTEIGDQFLHHCTTLTSVDLSGLTRLTRIGTNFLADCISLTTVNLSPFGNVTHISTSFLFNCSSLTSVDLSPLRNVTDIGSAFMENCSSLTSVDLSSLCNVTHINISFLQKCTSLTEVDLSPLRNVTHIGRGFLRKCISLTELDLSPLSRVTHFGELPANSYTSLRSIHLAGCSNAVSSRVREGELKKYVVDAPPPPPPTRGKGKTKAALTRCSVS